MNYHLKVIKCRLLFNEGIEEHCSSVVQIAGQHRWFKNLDYFRMDGSTSAQSRSAWSNEFNDEDNHRYCIAYR